MATAKLQLSFRIFQEGRLVRETQLRQGVIKIGKVASAHLHLDDEHVSRMHAIIEVLGDEVSVIDLGSTGGTFVNGARINRARLQAGDMLEVGNSRIELTAIESDLPSVVVEPSVVVAPAPAPARRAPAPPPLPLHTQTMPATPALPVIAMTPPAPAVVPPAPKTATGTGPLPVAPAALVGTAETGAGAVEVAAMLGDSVIGVKHCMDPRGGKITPATWGFAAGGLACLLASASAFYVSVDTAAQNQARLHQHIASGKPAHAFRAELVGPMTDGIAFGGLALGLVGLTTALARSRRERKHPGYRIGAAGGVEMPIDLAACGEVPPTKIDQPPTASFPMVAAKGDDFVFNYGAGMVGELAVDGRSTTFAELVAQGRAQASAVIPGAFELAIPANARIRARAGQTTFLVSAVDKPREQATSLFAIENRTLGYVGGSLAAHLAIVALLYSIPVADAGVNVDLASHEDPSLHSTISTREDPVNEPDKADQTGDDGASEPTAAMRLAEGTAGDPKQSHEGRMEMAKRNDGEQHMSRQEAIEYARTAGVLGSQLLTDGGLKSLTSQYDWSNGWSDADIYGGARGELVGGRGNFGGGRSGDGPGGGCFGTDCGTIGVKWGRLPINTRPGDEWGGPRDGWGKPRIHVGGVPPGGDPPRIKGDLDRSIIKRYIKRNQEKFAYCYEHELLAKPGIEGSVMVTFLISGSGNVQQAVGNGFDPAVASCVAGVIKNIDFPSPADGGNVQVNYPFTFHAAGSHQ